MASLVRISSAYIKESDNGTDLVFTVSLDQANPSEAITVEVSTVGDTAKTDSDFTPVSNQIVTFDPGVITQTIKVPIIGDTIYERTETLFVKLANPSANATIDPNQGEGVGTILNDDAIPTLSIADVEFSEDKANAVLTVTRTGNTTEIVTVGYTTVDGDAKTNTDYTSASGTLVFLANETTKEITVPILEDTLSEGNENFLVKLSGASNATIAKAEGVVTIIDNDAPPSLSIDSVTIAETAGGKNAVFTVTLSAASGQPVTVKYATADDTAVAGQDYTTTSGVLTFPPGTTTQQITVPILDDLKFESEEAFFVNLSDAVGATLSPGKGTGTITDDDPEATVLIAINDVTATEGNSGTTIARFTVSLSAASSRSISVDYALANDTTSANDATLTSGTLQFAAGETSKTIEVAVAGDTSDEVNETFFVNLTNPSNAEIGDGQGVGIITDDDGIPTVSIGDIKLKEGNSSTTAVFTVSLSNATDKVVEVNFVTSNGTANATDYTDSSGKLTFAAGELSKQIEVAVTGDRLAEPDETFLVTLSAAVNAELGKKQAQATLENDDSLPKISIADVRRIVEGNDGTTTATFFVTLSNPDTQPITVNYETADGTATIAGKDYVSTKGKLTFAPGEVKKSIDVMINGDINVETSETLFVNLSNASANAEISRAKATGTIANDDKLPSISIGDITVKEGNSSTTKAVFEVALDAAYSLPVTVDYKTLDETATTADKEYVAASGKLTFAAGKTTQTVTVLVNGDTQLESDETFLLELSNASNGTIADDRAVATIQNDDTNITPPALPTLSIQDISLKEGNSGTTNATFTLSLSTVSSQAVSVNYATADGTATVANADYTAVSGKSVTFAAGEKTKAISIAVTGDTKFEPDETFRLNLINPQNATLAKNSATATITNDDTQSSTNGGTGSNPSNSSTQAVELSGTPNADSLAGGNGNDIIYGLEGNDLLNGGAGHDFVSGGAGNDTLYGSAGIDLLAGDEGGDQLWGGDGDDVIYGGKGEDGLYGESGNDKLYGRPGKDLISGGDGDDLLVGNLGADRLLGGAGKDRFGFRKHKGSLDRIVDYSVQDDTILIDRLEFKGGLKLGTLNQKQFQLGKQAKDADDRFIYNRSTGILCFDRDGAGGAAQLQIAQFSKNPALIYREIIVSVNI